MGNEVNGVLWKCSKRRSLSPDLLGKFKVDPAMFKHIQKNVGKTGRCELQIAAWEAISAAGNRYYRLEVTELFNGNGDVDEDEEKPTGLYE